MRKAPEDISQRGFTVEGFSVPHSDRRRAALLGNRLIDIALDSSRIAEALHVKVGADGPAGEITEFLVGTPRYSDDTTRYLHTGWQTLSHAESVIPKREFPSEMKEYFEIQREILSAVGNTWLHFIEELAPGHPQITSMFAHHDKSNLNYHLRHNRYMDLTECSSANPTFSAHGDRSALSAQIFETHSGHLRIAPYKVRDIDSDPQLLRQRAEQARRLIESNVTSVEMRRHEIALFLGFGIRNLIDTETMENPFLDLNAAYHYGEPPGNDRPIDDAVEADFGKNVRVSMVAFGNPHIKTPYINYHQATKEACRPEQMLEKLLQALQD